MVCDDKSICCVNKSTCCVNKSTCCVNKPTCYMNNYAKLYSDLVYSEKLSRNSDLVKSLLRKAKSL